MKAIKGFLRLSSDEKIIFIEAYFLCVVISILVEIIPFKRLAGKLGKHMQETPEEIDAGTGKTALRTGVLIRKAVRFIPWKIKCLTRAVAGKLILRKRGISSTLYLGLKKNGGSNLEAHAWLRVGSEIITGKEVCNEFTVVSSFGE